MKIVIAVLALLLATSSSAAPRCGSERRPVKTLTDPGASLVDLEPSAVVSTTVEALRALPAPRYTEARPRNFTEQTVYRVTARLVGFKLEADQDFHVVIAGAKDSATMIVEFPSVACSQSSRVAAQIAAARVAFVQRFGKPTAKFKRLKQSVPITVIGVGFFDKIHGQTGVAPNGVELHPVLEIE